MQSAPESYWKDLELHQPAQVAAKLKMRMLILQGERDYQVRSGRSAWVARRAFGSHRRDDQELPRTESPLHRGQGKSTPSEYQRPGHVADYVVDDIAGWIGKVGAAAK